MKRVCAALALCLGCGPSTASRAPESEPEPAPEVVVDDASAQASAAPQDGAPIELDVPLVSGESEALANLRGRVVVLLISSSDRPGWQEFRRHFEAELSRVGRERLAVIAVANDPDPKGLLAEWDRNPPPFLLSWDPAGAVALRLGVAKLPAVFVLDAGGRLAGGVAQMDSDALRQVDRWVEDGLPAPTH